MTPEEKQPRTEILREACRCYQRLHLLLEKEHEQLCAFDDKGLLLTAFEKGSILGRLNEVEGKVKEYQLEFQELNVRRPAEQEGSLQELWNELLHWAEEVKRLQQRNHAMIAEGMAFCQEALACLQGPGYIQNLGYAPGLKALPQKPEAMCLRREV